MMIRPDIKADCLSAARENKSVIDEGIGRQKRRKKGVVVAKA